MTDHTYLVSKAIKAGKLTRQPCEQCGSEQVHAHHDNYSKPLDVRWLCPKHHRQHHTSIMVKKPQATVVRIRIDINQILITKKLALEYSIPVPTMAKILIIEGMRLRGLI